ncbi:MULTISPECIES: hypothetical protein [Mycolicibacter]|uniref:Uncharacterized protein n=2 Tax=Mycolicibacter TaxID=1073531 RepID=A0ABU5XMA7_9MYCO|nr:MULTISPECIES: hypothetical protein [unclassified Mycolicibacter]MEB3023423.1 hypothetical protein [Mycolicibacter sp. MYC098]MEB3033765.1 hypothetical protein [Mycolicibacter sp. MYC340]
MAAIQSTKALVDDPVGGLLTVTEGMMHYLTRCCGASAKGSADGLVMCRACHGDVGPELRAAWMLDDNESWAWYQDRLSAYYGDQASLVANQIRQQAIERTHAATMALAEMVNSVMADVQSVGALVDDPVAGLLTVTEGMMHYLTRCCGASAEGSAYGVSGVVCRACDRDVAAELVAAWTVDDDQSWAQYQDRLSAYYGSQASLVVNQIRQRAIERTNMASSAA